MMQMKSIEAANVFGLKPSALFDPELPSANAVMATLNCVAARYAMQPSLELAELASSLAYKLTAPEYTESKLIEEVAKSLVFQWDKVVRTYLEALERSTNTFLLN